jgi:tRNA (mo5U34)-methyltransferase
MTGTLSLQSQVEALKPWFHSIEIAEQLVTPGAVSLAIERALSDIYFGMGISGLSVLDIGAWDGFYSFEAEARGASRVVAVDKYAWEGAGNSAGKKACFEFARKARQSRVEDRVVNIAETNIATLGRFDLVLFNGLFYHLADAMAALRQAAEMAVQIITVETFVDLWNEQRPAMVFYPGETHAPTHPQTGWGPNSTCMFALLRHLGFPTVLEFPTLQFEHDRSAFIGFRDPSRFSAFISQHAGNGVPRRRPLLTPSPGPSRTGVFRRLLRQR